VCALVASRMRFTAPAAQSAAGSAVEG